MIQSPLQNMKIVKKFLVFVIILVISFVIAAGAVAIQIDGIGEGEKLTSEDSTGIYLTMIITTIVSIALAIYVIFEFKKTITPLQKISTVIEKVSEGDLTEDIESTSSQNEIGCITNSSKKMVDNLRIIVGKLQNITTTVSADSSQLAASSEEIDSSVQQISTAIDQISKGSQDQAVRALQTKESVGSILKSTNQLADDAKKSSNLSNDTEKLSRKSAEAANEAKDTLDKIEDTVNKSAKDIQSLSKKTNEINEVLKTIQQIADQTNLLALNAAIEAASAGDAGRGFAVVAEEVRRLAESSADASNTIAKRLGQIKEESNEVLEAIELGVHDVVIGKKIINSSLAQIVQIADNINTVTESINRISDSSSAQIPHIENISTDTIEVASISEENAASTEETSAAIDEQLAQVTEISQSAHHLKESAQELSGIIRQFNINSSKNSQ